MIPVKLPDNLVWYRDLLQKQLWPNKKKKETETPQDWIAWSQTLHDIFVACGISEPNIPEQVPTLVEKIFLLRFEALSELREQIDKKVPKKPEQMKRLEELGTYFLKKYNDFSRKGINTDIIDKIGLRVCPYCNENYIENRKLRRGMLPKNDSIRSAAQLDHFFPKKYVNYGIFSLTLANLVPACPVCNHIKGTQELKVSPYMSGRKLDDVKFTWISKKREPLPNTIGDMTLILRADSSSNQIAKDILEDMETLHLAKRIMGKNESYYLPHRREAFLLLHETRRYSRTHLDMLWREFGKLLGFSSKEMMFKHLLGVLYSEGDAGSHSLGKLQLDFVRSAYKTL